MASSSFKPPSSFLELVSTSSLNYRECALLGIMALISHDTPIASPSSPGTSKSTTGNDAGALEEYIATALHYGATESEIQNVVFQSSFSVGAARAVAVRARVESALKSSLRGRLHHLEKEVLVGEMGGTQPGSHKTVVRDSDPQNTSVVPIVLIHALGLDRRMWDAVFASLAASGAGDKSTQLRIISYDMRGHGYAANAPSAQSLDELAADLHSILERLHIPKADVYGQSYGGAVAQYFALNYPQSTRSLGLITTAGEAQPSWITRATRAEESSSVMSLLPETLIRWFTPGAIARNEWGVRYARSCVERISVKDWGDAWRCMSQLDTLDRLQSGGVKCPVLLVCGVQDLSTGPKWMTRLKEACEKGGSGLVVYKEVDPGVHMMALEQGEALTREILEFRQRVDSEGL
ncbi:uncharacterized protein Z520_08040 [Fonsecaea multimorphosa CBS 102226]|uniref:AB hydrolase-1 domain-containing protein n=1 Tax=Fonsecaea multimorphosa CBS 102226 TaxID=1442371 RepID=A0A0D2JS29_9EURO|nr:uncharacterized protein Z520_08040 [Fonsecaea multimorphosa CBS 102226]KIX96262.1 hypothetical protein Z520_08040 [Fonsecaea multimorphosa CBS 102226]OAL21925.1 hypothetical protein AYO22_07522 [Fonsecaea multimorphosa]